MKIREEAKKIHNHYYKDDWYEVIEWEITKLNGCLEQCAKIIIPSIKKLVLEDEMDYWRSNNLILFNKIQSLVFNYYKEY